MQYILSSVSLDLLPVKHNVIRVLTFVYRIFYGSNRDIWTEFKSQFTRRPETLSDRLMWQAYTWI